MGQKILISNNSALKMGNTIEQDLKGNLKSQVLTLEENVRWTSMS